jgi:hypothetical protein
MGERNDYIAMSVGVVFILVFPFLDGKGYGFSIYHNDLVSF